MLLNQFPDINWLREQARTNFQNKKGIGNFQLLDSGWPNVVLNTKSNGAERTGIKAPFSIFLNISGKSRVKAGGKEVLLTENNFCIVNKDQFYDLLIPEYAETNTFNIHFGDRLFSEVSHALNSTTQKLLDNPLEELRFPDVQIKSEWKTEKLSNLLYCLSQLYKEAPIDTPQHAEYELLSDVLGHVIESCRKDLRSLDQLNVLKASTRKELMSRINLSIDYMHAHFNTDISLDRLSEVACLSKYHYLRTFREVMKCTPLQMISRLRFNKAQALILNTDKPLSEISVEVGFSELASFSRFFTKHSHSSPKALRKSSSFNA